MIGIVEINNRLENGCTKPYVVWCDDGNKYVVKFPGNPERKKPLVNEYVASRLCSYLELPIMPYQLISVKMENYKEDMDEEILRVEGTAFGTIYEDHLLTVINANEVKKSTNNYDAIKILIFDLLVANYDRNQGNLMINSKTKEIIMIDHTHIFELGPIWDRVQLDRIEQEEFDLTRLHPFNYNNLINSIEINDEVISIANNFAEKVKNIEREYVENIMNDIPTDWDVSNEEKESLTNFIVNRFRRVEKTLELLNLRGGGNNEE